MSDPQHGPKATTWRWWPPAASKARCCSARTSLAGSRTPLPRAPAGPRVLNPGCGLPAQPCRTSARLLGAAPITHSVLRDPSVLPRWPGVTRSSLMCAQTPPPLHLCSPRTSSRSSRSILGAKRSERSLGKKSRNLGLLPALPSERKSRQVAIPRRRGRVQERSYF